MVEHDRANLGDAQIPNPLARAMDILLAPPGPEVGIDLFQVLDQVADVRIERGPDEVAAEARQDLQRLILPGIEQGAHRGGGKQQPEQVAALGRKAREAKQPIGRSIPGQHVPTQVQHIRRAQRQIGHQPVHEGRNHAPRLARLWRQALMGQQEQMATFCRIELERARQVLEKCRRYADIPALLQPGVPGQPHPSERGHLLSSKARRTAPDARRQANLLRRNAFTAAAQEVGKLGAVSFEASRCAHPITSSNSITSQIVTPWQRY